MRTKALMLLMCMALGASAPLDGPVGRSGARGQGHARCSRRS